MIVQEKTMAEGMLDGTPEDEGDEDVEKPEIESPEALAAAAAFASAAVAIAARQDADVARSAKIFLDQQVLLIETRRRHLKDEQALRLSRLLDQSREGKL